MAIMTFFLLGAAQCMELGRAASSGRLAEMPEASDRAGPLIGSSEEAKMSKSYRDPFKDRSSVKPENHNLEASVGDIDKMFQLRQDSLENFQKSITKSMKTRDGGEAVGIYDDFANELRFSAGELHSLREDIFKISKIRDRKDNMNLVIRLENILGHTPPANFPMRQGITTIENEALQVQARELEAMIFQTIDFMHDKNLISPVERGAFFQREPAKPRFALHMMMDSKGQDSDVYVRLHTKGGLTPANQASEHLSKPTTANMFEKAPHPYYSLGPDGITKHSVDIDTQFEGTRNDLQKLLSQILQSSKEEKSEPASYYGQMTRKFRENAEELNSIHEKILQSASQLHGENLDQLNRLKTTLNELPLLKDIGDQFNRKEMIKLRHYAQELQASIFQTVDFMAQKKMITLDEFQGFFRDENAMKHLASHLVLSIDH
ncbi:uncharacterized protein PGTG_02585 [Puccinia graminis f. sp. tritici CRL 75-36-700-3]|uniref:Uncharacterized protein n=1 Tax=Puccinia graminis f. sp. tritici (strain CRL 75-36-700-3 / race SCCL) TaxID=418459 RepID=E3JVR9_PUCGT|nr:uncharacterized protein PGTG_02585 [Puccinia graminis f. sp. tritici CRL 75-36-700-3]EFP76144.2 hypothetical protein PGTG_02585 [Puccinia graminis f. sp. tritici CRL 75-36-700-3]